MTAEQPSNADERTQRRGALRRVAWAVTPKFRAARRVSTWAFSTTLATKRERAVWGGVAADWGRRLRWLLTRQRPAPAIFPFEEVLEEWGIAEWQIRRVRLYLVIETVGYAVICVVSLTVLAFVSMPYWGSLIVAPAVTVMAAVGAVVRFWRSEVLRRREWIPIGRWLLGG